MRLWLGHNNKPALVHTESLDDAGQTDFAGSNSSFSHTEETVALESLLASRGKSESCPSTLFVLFPQYVAVQIDGLQKRSTL